MLWVYYIQDWRDLIRGKDGFRCCILKGQGLALHYPNPYMRTPGDIDVWVSVGRRKVMQYEEERCPGENMR